MSMSMTVPKNTTNTTNTTKSPSSGYLSKHRDRKHLVLQLSYLPIGVCVLAFGRSAYYRLFSPTPPECQRFGWFSSSSGEFQCDHVPLDFHATAALSWLATFAVQAGCMILGWNRAHKVLGKLGFVVAFVNAGGMFWLAIHDTLHPMAKTDRPADFTPFMFLVAIKLTACLVLSLRAVFAMKRGNNSQNVEDHFLWMFRGFITSFTTPVIRFYPAVLRHLAGDDCFQQHRDKFVMGAMFVSELTCVIIYVLVQRKTRVQFWDVFMMLQALTFFFALVKEIRFAATHGTFIAGIVQCAMETHTSSSS